NRRTFGGFSCGLCSAWTTLGSTMQWCEELDHMWVPPAGTSQSTACTRIFFRYGPVKEPPNHSSRRGCLRIQAVAALQILAIAWAVSVVCGLHPTPSPAYRSNQSAVTKQ